ncbi:cytochrome P450 [Trametes meyenii]|nr:cytochrome P450 [Trametes meyenii]
MANEALTLALAAALAWVVYTLWQRRYASPVRLLPTPPGAELVWGHEKTVYMNQPGVAFRKWTSELGLTYRIKAAFGANDVLVLSDTEGIAHILQKKIYDYHHSRVVRPRVARLLGKGLGWVEGADEHKRMRHLVAPSLSPENVKGMSSDIRHSALEVIDDLTGLVQGKTDKEPINILEWTAKATLNVVGRVAFLHDFQGGNSPEAEKILTARRAGVSKAAAYANFIVLMLLRRFPILNDLPIPQLQSQGFAKMAIHSGIAQELVKRNQDVLKGADVKSQKDLLSRLLVAHGQGKISEEELYEQISTFIVSGHETTTQTLGFTIFELSRQPKVQERLREELKQFPSEPTYDDYQTRLPYLDGVLKETLRMYPGLAYMERVAMAPDVIPLREPVKLSTGEITKQLAILPGQVVLIPAMSIQRAQDVWGGDADTFKPERWLGELPPADQLPSGWANTLAFSDGPRNCIGYRLAIFQYKIILTYLMERFRFVDAHEEISLKIASSLQPWVNGKPELGAALPVHLELL